MEENKDTLLGKFIKNLELEQFIHKNVYAMNLE